MVDNNIWAWVFRQNYCQPKVCWSFVNIVSSRMSMRKNTLLHKKRIFCLSQRNIAFPNTSFKFVKGFFYQKRAIKCILHLKEYFSEELKCNKLLDISYFNRWRKDTYPGKGKVFSFWNLRLLLSFFLTSYSPSKTFFTKWKCSVIFPSKKLSDKI